MHQGIKMNNKFTEAIDRAFEVLGSKDSKILILGHCYRDHDGEWNHVGEIFDAEEDAAEFNVYDYDCCPLETPDYETDGCKAAMKAFDDLVQMIHRSYPDKIKADYEGTNEYWTRYYFITRDYQLKSACTMEHNLDREMNRDQLIMDFSAIPADQADSAEEKEAIKQIKDHFNSIIDLIDRVKTEVGRKTISNLIVNFQEKFNLETSIGSVKNSSTSTRGE